MFEQPFIYAYNTDDLTAGQNYENVIINLQSDAPFVARALNIDSDEADIVTVEPGNVRAMDSYRMYGPTGNYLSSRPETMGRMFVPEIEYPAGGQIRFDLYGVLKPANYNDDPVVLPPTYKGQFLVQGVKRFPYDPIDSPYQYKRRWYLYRQDITIDWTGRVGPTFANWAAPRTWAIEIRDFDFELHRIYLDEQALGLFKYTLYDSAQNALSNVPVIDALSLTYGYYQRSAIGFPTPHLLYRVGSQIKIDIYSLLTPAGTGNPAYSEVPQTLRLYFQGCQRIPTR